MSVLSWGTIVEEDQLPTKAKQTKLKMPFNGNNYLTANLPEYLR